MPTLFTFKVLHWCTHFGTCNHLVILSLFRSSLIVSNEILAGRWDNERGYNATNRNKVDGNALAVVSSYKLNVSCRSRYIRHNKRDAILAYKRIHVYMTCLCVGVTYLAFCSTPSPCSRSASQNTAGRTISGRSAILYRLIHFLHPSRLKEALSHCAALTKRCRNAGKMPAYVRLRPGSESACATAAAVHVGNDRLIKALLKAAADAAAAACAQPSAA